MISAYLRKYKWLHICVCALYALLFFAEITVAGEMFYNKGLNKKSLEELSYSFEIDTTGRSTLDELLSFSDKVGDICLVSKTDVLDIICYPQGVMPDRVKSEDFSYNLQPGQAYMTATANIPEQLEIDYFDDVNKAGKQFEYNGNNYSLMRFVNIENTYVKREWSFSIFLSYEDFINEVRNEDKIVISYCFENSPDNTELSRLKKFVKSKSPNSIYLEQAPNTDELDFILDFSNSFVWVATFLAALCFARLMIVLLKNRTIEYKIFELLGAKKTWLVCSKITYVFALLSISALTGGILYLIVQKVTDNLLVYTRNSFMFWSSSLLIYYLAAGLAVLFMHIIERVKYGNEY